MEAEWQHLPLFPILPWEEVPEENLPGSLCIEHPLGTKHRPLELTQSSEGLRQKYFSRSSILKEEASKTVFKNRRKQSAQRRVVCVP